MSLFYWRQNNAGQGIWKGTDELLGGKSHEPNALCSFLPRGRHQNLREARIPNRPLGTSDQPCTVEPIVEDQLGDDYHDKAKIRRYAQLWFSLNLPKRVFSTISIRIRLQLPPFVEDNALLHANIMIIIQCTSPISQISSDESLFFLLFQRIDFLVE